MTIKELRTLSGMTLTEFSKYFKIPYRSLQNWEREERKSPDYLPPLLEYKLINEGVITMKDVMYKAITNYTDGLSEEESRQMIKKMASDEEWELWQKYLDDIDAGEVYDGIEYMIDEIPSLADKLYKFCTE